MQPPLITFLVLGFNQEAFIEEAVRAAFAQTYSPLEIVLSDDCSSDATFAKMEALARTYQGPHKIILNRNSERLSLGGHINRGMAISHGELVIVQAGDDVSTPDRTSLLHQAWEGSGRTATSIHSDFIQIDAQGKPLAPIIRPDLVRSGGEPLHQSVDPLVYLRTLQPGVFGCTHAWSRSLFTTFGNLRDDLIHEDNVLVFRTLLAGRLFHVNRELVHYRIHGSNIFLRHHGARVDVEGLRKQEERLRRDFRNREVMYRSFSDDIETAGRLRLIDPDRARSLRAYADLRARSWALKQEFFTKSFIERCGILVRLWRDGVRYRELKPLGVRLAPEPFLLRLRLLKNQTMHAFRRGS